MIKYDRSNRIILNKGKHMTPKEVQDIMDKVKRESVKQATSLVFSSIVLVMRDEFRFGEKRLRKMIDKLNEVLNDIGEGYLDVNDIKKTIKEECNIDL